MRGVEKFALGQRLDRMIGAHQAAVRIAKQRAPAHRRPEARQEAHRQIERATGERVGDVLHLERYGFQPHPGRRPLRALDERRQELDLSQVRHVEAEGARRAPRIEARPMRERAVEKRERLAHRLRHAAREGRRLHAGGRAYEERIAKERAQPRERIGHCGLRQSQPCRSGGHAALLEHGVEHAQQVEIDVSCIHSGDTYHACH